MYTDRCGNTCRQKCCAKGSGKEVKIQEFKYKDTTNVGSEMYNCTSNNWSHWNSNEKLKEKFGSCTGKIIRDKKSILIDVAISGDRNVIKKEAEEILKHKDFIIEIHRMSNVISKVVPVTIGVTGTTSKSLRQYLTNIPRNHEIKELQKTAILCTAHKLREVLM